MGGAVILLAGDFRQTVHVIQQVKKIKLSTNIRVYLLKDDSPRTFVQKLLNSASIH